jgi:hypothetical protein
MGGQSFDRWTRAREVLFPEITVTAPTIQEKKLLLTLCVDFEKELHPSTHCWWALYGAQLLHFHIPFGRRSILHDSEMFEKFATLMEWLEDYTLQ